MKAVVLLFDKRRGCNKTSKSSGCREICNVNIKQQPSPPLSPPLLREISLKGARCNSGLRRIPSFSLRRSRPRKPQGYLLRRPFKTERRWRWRSQGSERRGEVRKEKKVPLLNCRGQKRTPPPCERVETTQKKAPPERRRQKKRVTGQSALLHSPTSEAEEVTERSTLERKGHLDSGQTHFFSCEGGREPALRYSQPSFPPPTPNNS